MRGSIKIFLAISIVFLFTSCAESNREPIVNTTEGGEMVSYVQEEDEAMNLAMLEARNSFDDFVKVWKKNRRNPAYANFSIKIGFDSPQFGKEHMWVSELRIKNDTIRGVLHNAPMDEAIPYKSGDLVTIDPTKVSDWMYNIVNEEDNSVKTRGGYTIKALSTKMSTEEAKEFYESIGIVFAD